MSGRERRRRALPRRRTWRGRRTLACSRSRPRRLSALRGAPVSQKRSRAEAREPSSAPAVSSARCRPKARPRWSGVTASVISAVARCATQPLAGSVEQPPAEHLRPAARHCDERLAENRQTVAPANPGHALAVPVAACSGNGRHQRDDENCCRPRRGQGWLWRRQVRRPGTAAAAGKSSRSETSARNDTPLKSHTARGSGRRRTTGDGPSVTADSWAVSGQAWRRAGLALSVAR